MTARDGVIVVDKPSGVVSMRVVEQVRRITKIRRAGHAGTLDPMATGVLPVCVGQATKIASFLLGVDKEYLATARLGLETETYDLDGAVVSTSTVPASLSSGLIEEHLAALTGRIVQRPPVFSAIRVGGERLYRKARRGEAVEAPEREVEIHELELLDWSSPDVRLRIRCGKGTYIRSLASDLGKRLGLGACLVELRRTRVGRLGEDRSCTLEELRECISGGRLEDVLISPASALSHMPSSILNDRGRERVRKGQQVGADDLVGGVLPSSSTQVRLLDGEGALVALAEPRPGCLQPRKVFT